MSPRSRFISWGLPYRASNFPPMNVCASQVIRFGPPAKRLRSTSIRPLLFCLWIASITSLCCSRNQIPAGHDSGIEVASDSSSKPIAATASSTISPSFSVVPSACGTANPSHRRLHGPTRGKLFTVRFHPIQATLRNHQHPFVQYLVVGARAWFTRRRISVRSASHPHFAWIQRAIRSQSESPSSGHSANRLRNTRTSLPVGRTSRLEKRQRVLASTP